MSGDDEHRELLIFGRDPQPGKSKTRLIPALGADKAAQLYEAMLRRTLQISRAVNVDRHSLWLDTWLPQSRIRSDAEQQGFTVRRQIGNTLGQRMEQAFSDTLTGGRSAVLIGSDCPALTVSYIEQAFAALRLHDAVLGPALDGGYVLIGLNRPEQAVFDAVAWASSRVLEQTRQRLQDIGWRWAELPVLRDIDEPADLVFLPPKLRRVVEPC